VAREDGEEEQTSVSLLDGRPTGDADRAQAIGREHVQVVDACASG